MNFIHENFLLHSRTAERLYHSHACGQPILDYHSHLPPADIAANRQFANLFEIWLEGDHYKWRAMRADGVAEEFCTGNAAPYEKFAAWARTVPATIRNPLYHWTHLELKRYFGIDDLLDEGTAKSVWERANAALQNDKLSAQGILRKFSVRIVCTTDDPCEDLAHHQAVAAAQPGFRVYPTFRPDKALLVDQPEAFNAWITRLERASNIAVSSLQTFLDALKQRHDFFHAQGARLSDHGIPYCYANPCSDREAEAIFAKARAGSVATPAEHEQFASVLMLFLGKLDADRGWTKQLHLGALRSVNGRALKEIGPDTGFDTIGDWPQAEPLNKYLDLLQRENALPKMVLYNLNPADNYVFSAALGSFQDGVTAGKIQFGSGWWFLDQKEAIEWQLNALSNNGLFSRFIGMLTDSRSFMSFPRHEYFRRVLCDLLGRDVENGELPNDEKLLGTVVRNICFENARQFLGLQL
ncbi:MAG TPA: glucuronate isomerase [Candidatus Eisenbacteria bacterium]|jgi:glucuronate isomerase|nr:glucuronate isomerase [Candidatus Eisenbacteria bacterium]